MKPLPDPRYLRECLSYDPETGALTWKERPLHHFKHADSQCRCNSARAGKVAGTRSQTGYMILMIDSRSFWAHRVIWALQTGAWSGRLDHKNGNRADNRWENLREATQRENRWNTRNNRELPKGVTLEPSGRFRARAAVIDTSGKRVMKPLGMFSTPEEAHAAWCDSVRDQRGDFFRK